MPLTEQSKCDGTSYSIYATPEGVKLLSDFINQCSSLQYLRITGYEPGRHWDELFDLLKKHKALKGIELFYNDGLKRVPNQIKQNPNLKVISIVGNRRLDYNHLFKKLQGLDSLQKIALVDNKLRDVPSSLKKVRSLRQLHISGNENLNYEDLVDELEQTNIEELSIPLNSLSDIPQNISKLKQLKVLDIRKNFIADIPEGVSQLDSLKGLRVEDNLILDLETEFSELKDLNIKYLSFDAENNNEVGKIKEMFPNATVKGKVIKSEDEGAENSNMAADNFNKEGIAEVEKCTLAIEKYNDIFLKRNNYYSVDTTDFFERLVHSDYAYNERVLADGTYEGVPLLLHSKWKLFHRNINYPKYKTKKGEVAFSICPEGNLYPELKAFNGMLWIYVGPKSKKQFFNSYVKRKKWKDVFIEFDEVNRTFFVVLKGDGLVKIPAYPRYVNINASLKHAKLHYPKKFEMYERRIGLRGDRFNRAIRRSQLKSEKRKGKLEEANWKKLRRYMCDYELELTRKGWMSFREYVIAKDHEKLDTVMVTHSNLVLSCKAKRVLFKSAKNSAAAKNFINPVSGNVNLQLKSKNGEEVVEHIYVYYPTLYQLTQQVGHSIQFNNNLNFVVIFKTQNGWQIHSKSSFLNTVRSGFEEKGPIEFHLDKSFNFPTLELFWEIVKNNQ